MIGSDDVKTTIVANKIAYKLLVCFFTVMFISRLMLEYSATRAGGGLDY